MPRSWTRWWGVGSQRAPWPRSYARWRRPVPPSEEAAARALVARVLAQRQPGRGPAVWVRINDSEGELWREDLAAVVGPAVAGVRLPKVESVASVRRVEEALGRAEEAAGLA